MLVGYFLTTDRINMTYYMYLAFDGQKGNIYVFQVLHLLYNGVYYL